MTGKYTSSSSSTLPRKISRGKSIPRKPATERMIDFLKSLGEWRDRALVITGLFYAAGYLIWSWNALRNNLGLLPAFQFQYIVAGIIPVMISLISIAGGLWVWRFLTDVWLKKMEPNATGIWRHLRSLFGILAVLSFVGLIFPTDPTVTLIGLAILLSYFLWKRSNFTAYEKLSNAARMGRLVPVFLVAVLLCWGWTQRELIDQAILGNLEKIISGDQLIVWSSILLAISILFGPPTLLPDWLTRFYRIIYFLLIVLGFAIVSLFYYQERIYTRLPQEFGGVKPRCAYLDLKTENLSSETRRAILVPSEEALDNQIVRTNKLDVLFTSGSIIMVRANQGSLEPENTVYEIPRANVQAITWCR